MTEKWFFTRDDDVVLLRGRFEADDGTIGDAFNVVRPGERVFGFSYRKAVQREGGHARDREGREGAHRVAGSGALRCARAARKGRPGRIRCAGPSSGFAVPPVSLAG
jgi:hypothetical protein